MQHIAAAPIARKAAIIAKIAGTTPHRSGIPTNIPAKISRTISHVLIDFFCSGGGEGG